MIELEDILAARPVEEVYTWQNDKDDGNVRMWATQRLEKWLPTSGLPISKGAIDPDRARWFIENRGIEQHRVSWLMRNPYALVNPMIMMRMQKSANELEFWDLMLDGHHRYIALTALRKPYFALYHLQEHQIKDFEIAGHPQPEGELNINAFSGITRG